MRRTVKNNRGITLIALIVTIIVLLILAGVAITMLSGENGILKQAAKAKLDSEKNAEQESVRLSAIASMTNSKSEVNETILKSELDSYFGTDGYDIDKIEDGWEVVIDKTKNHYVISENGETNSGNDGTNSRKWWYTDDQTITDGTDILKIGDTITNYNPYSNVVQEYESKADKNGNSDQTFTISNNDVQKLEWRVLGVDNNGDVLIMPTSNIKDELGSDYIFNIGHYTNTDSQKKAAQYAEQEINNVAKIYGHGNKAKSARSFKMEDLSRYIDLTPGRFEDAPENYGQEVTYSFKNGYVVSDWPGYEDDKTYTGFIYLDNNTWKQLGKDEYLTVKSTFLDVFMETILYDENSKITLDHFEKNNNLYSLICGGDSYWTGTSYIATTGSYIGYGMHSIVVYNAWYYGSYKEFYISGVVNGEESLGDHGDGSLGIRPVVTLESDVIFEPDGQNAWKLK